MPEKIKEPWKNNVFPAYDVPLHTTRNQSKHQAKESYIKTKRKIRERLELIEKTQRELGRDLLDLEEIILKYLN